MRNFLVELEDTNNKCRIQLAKLLSQRHQVRMAAGRGDYPAHCGQGLVAFGAFDPWHTCLRHSLGASRFFEAAERKGVITSSNAATLCRLLLKRAREISSSYNGRFSHYFYDKTVQTILRHADEPEHLTEAGLAIGAIVDHLFEACPWALEPNVHLNAELFCDVKVPEDITTLNKTPWQSWVNTLDFIHFGPWSGLHIDDVVAIVDGIRTNSFNGTPSTLKMGVAGLGSRVILPIFSQGLQGVVVGTFHNVPEDQKSPIISTLLQFGLTLADAYAALRTKRFTQALHEKPGAQELAKSVICVTSPVNRVIATKDGEHFGYRLVYEHNYWGGYDPIPPRELEDGVSTCGFRLELPGNASIYIEPVSDVPSFDGEFARIRIENCLRDALYSRIKSSIHSPLTLDDVRKIKDTLHFYADDRNASLSTLRKYYIVCRVEESWHEGGTRIFNARLKAFLEDKKGRRIGSGYQASSFLDEVVRLFANKIGVTKTGKGLSLTWSDKR